MSHPNRSKPTAFMQFWNAINKALKRRGIPEMTFGPARELWREAVHEAEADYFRREIARIAQCGRQS